MSVLTHLLVALFGLGSWISVNGLWVELPLLVPQVPEGWHLPSYLSVLIQMANVGPVCVTLMHRLRPGALNEAAVIYGIIGLGTAASFLLGFLWKETAVVAGAPRSVALLVLTFFLSAVDCTSSVTFLPFMMHLQPQFLTTYYMGEGVSGLLPALVALVQGVGLVTCVNSTWSLNHTLNSSSSFGTFDLQAQYESAKFSAEVFFFFLSAMMVVCLLAFVLLNYHPSVARERGPNRRTPGVRGDAQELKLRCLMGSRGAQQKSRFGTVLLLPAVWKQHLSPISRDGCSVQPPRLLYCSVCPHQVSVVDGSSHSTWQRSWRLLTEHGGPESVSPARG